MSGVPLIRHILTYSCRKGSANGQPPDARTNLKREWRHADRIAVVAIDAVQPHLIAGFWCSALGWQVVEEDGEVISIAPSDGAWPTIDVLAVPERKTVKNGCTSTYAQTG